MNDFPTSCDVLVLGAGPAGCATALGLARLGYAVCIAGDWRRFNAIEGISARALQGLQQAGLIRTAAIASNPTLRVAHWNGDERASNQEILLERRRLDGALREDLADAEVPMLPASIRSWQAHASGHVVQLDISGEPHTLNAGFVVEARGRLAPTQAQGRKGPQTLGLLHAWQGSPVGQDYAGIESMEKGWAWMACLADGRRYWQYTLDPGHTELPSRNRIAHWTQPLRQSPLALQVLGLPPEPAQIALTARPSTATLHADTGSANWLRVGDAAMAVDPLSGNGIFQSLSSALQAPAVAHTLMQRPGEAALALQFHAQRIAHLFLRFARTGRDFYALEQRWAEHPFWRERSVWPDLEPLHTPPDAQLSLASRPVLDGHYIRQAQVVVSPDQPLGIWRVAGVEVAPLVDGLQRARPVRESEDWLQGQLQALPPASRPALLGWLQAHGLLGNAH